jgi:hypothetical protein
MWRAGGTVWAAILDPVLLQPRASGRCLIAVGGFNTRAPLASTRIFGSLVAGGRFELCSAYPIRVSAVSASIVATR